jgi:hypothetical protein
MPRIGSSTPCGVPVAVTKFAYVSSSGGAANMKTVTTAAVSTTIATSSQRPDRVSTSLRSSTCSSRLIGTAPDSSRPGRAEARVLTRGLLS